MGRIKTKTWKLSIVILSVDKSIEALYAVHIWNRLWGHNEFKDLSFQFLASFSKFLVSELPKQGEYIS